MYLIITSVRFVIKNIKLSKNFWNFLNETIVYIKNRTIIINAKHDKHITFYKNINNVVSNVLNLRTLNCRTYTYISKTTLRYKLNDRSWKNIFVDYKDNN